MFSKWHLGQTQRKSDPPWHSIPTQTNYHGHHIDARDRRNQFLGGRGMVWNDLVLPGECQWCGIRVAQSLHVNPTVQQQVSLLLAKSCQLTHFVSHKSSKKSSTMIYLGSVQTYCKTLSNSTIITSSAISLATIVF